jgi:uncharacterized protein YutE (UPF0331/DUF86 family)
VVDKDRILAKLDQLEGYLRELRQILPESFAGYQNVEKKRACERLLQIAIEAVIDICHMFLRELRLGLPSEEDDVFDKLSQAGVISSQMVATLKRMKGLHNNLYIFVYEYGRVDDRIVYNQAHQGIQNFARFKEEILGALVRIGVGGSSCAE